MRSHIVANKALLSAIACSCFMLAACGFVHDEVLVGPYRLIAVDSDEEMTVCYSVERGNCVGRIKETVFAVGWNARYIVAKQHPGGNRAVTNFFILEIPADTKLAEPSVSVRGPLSATEYEKESLSTHLPPFSKTFASLQ